MSNEIIQKAPCNDQKETIVIKNIDESKPFNENSIDNSICRMEGQPTLATQDQCISENEITPITNILPDVVPEVQQFVDCSNDKIQENDNTVTIVTSQEDLTTPPLKVIIDNEVGEIVSPIDTLKIIVDQPDSAPVELATLVSVETLPTHPVEINPVPRNDIWLNNSLVPYQFKCNSCGIQTKLLVSYPVTENINEPRPFLQEDIVPSTCNCVAQKGFCNCCSDCPQCRRKPHIPFGKRFPADVDSLDRLAGVDLTPYKDLHNILRREYTAVINSARSSGYKKNGKEQPKVYVDDFSVSSGSGYYSDAVKDVIFKEPTRVDIVKTSNYPQPIVTHERIEEPHLYKVIPKFNIVPKTIASLEIPDLVPTNKYVCSCSPIDSSRHPIIGRPSVCPIHGIIPIFSDNIPTLVVDIPSERNPVYGPHFLRHINVLRGIP